MNAINQEFENMGNRTATKYIKTSFWNNNPKKNMELFKQIRLKKQNKK